MAEGLATQAGLRPRLSESDNKPRLEITRDEASHSESLTEWENRDGGEPATHTGSDWQMGGTGRPPPTQAPGSSLSGPLWVGAEVG